MMAGWSVVVKFFIFSFVGLAAFGLLPVSRTLSLGVTLEPEASSGTQNTKAETFPRDALV